jgi:hypothetical protein
MNRNLVTACALLVLAAVRVAAQCSSEPLAALAPGTGAGWQFGTAVALNGNELLVSQPGWPYGDKPAGRLSIFRFFGGHWIYETSLLAPNATTGLGFGSCLVVKGDFLAVGDVASFTGDLLPGAVFLFEKQASLWTLRQKLVPADPSNSQFFGAAVAVDGERMVVGGWGDGSPFESGAAWVFERHGLSWEQVAKLKPADLGFADLFGSGVAISGDWIAVGMPGDNSTFGPGGRVYIFHRDANGAWTQTQVLTSTAITGGDYLGLRLAMQGDTLLASAHLEKLDPIGFTSGAVYDFEREGNTWVLAQKLIANDPDDAEFFGGSLALDGNRLAVGSGLLSALTGGPGAVHVFERSDGVWTRRWTVDAPAALGQPAGFGGSVALDDTRIAVGCDRDDTLGKDAGQAYAFEFGDLHLPFGAGVPGKGGLVPELLGTTCGRIGDQDLLLTVQHGLGGASGVLLAGAAIDALPFKGGVVYPSAPWRVHPHVLGGAMGVAGAGSWEISGHVPATLMPLSLVAQVIYADADAAQGWSLSGGLLITLP